MKLLQTLLAFIGAISLLVLVHELGHYWLARLCNVKVLRFSLGIGRVLVSRKFGRDQTEWALSLLPLGGYVKLLDARAHDMASLPPEDHSREFTSQNVWRRAAIVAAGPLANFLLAIIILAGLFVYGIPEPTARLRSVAEGTAAYQAGLRGGELVTAVNGKPIQSWTDLRWKTMEAVLEEVPLRLEVRQSSAADAVSIAELSLVDLKANELEKNFMAHIGLSPSRPPALIGKLSAEGPAMKSGLQPGDRILSVNGKAILDSLDFIELVRASPGETLKLAVVRGQQAFTVTVTPEAALENGKAVGKIQAEIPVAPEMTIVTDSVPVALYKGAAKTWSTSIVSVKMLGRMIVGDISLRNVTGPITIADYAGQTARAGLIRYFQFVAFISISIGVMNLLPIPVLDGGLLLYYAVEMLTGRTISGRFAEIAQRVGLAILMALMVVAVFNDFVRLLT